MNAEGYRALSAVLSPLKPRVLTLLGYFVGGKSNMPFGERIPNWCLVQVQAGHGWRARRRPSNR